MTRAVTTANVWRGGEDGQRIVEWKFQRDGGGWPFDEGDKWQQQANEIKMPSVVGGGTKRVGTEQGKSIVEGESCWNIASKIKIQTTNYYCARMIKFYEEIFVCSWG